MYELIADQLAGGQLTMRGWLAERLSQTEREALRALSPFARFKRGEALALMPTAFVR
jgi:hypothetical protein